MLSQSGALKGLHLFSPSPQSKDYQNVYMFIIPEFPLMDHWQ